MLQRFGESLPPREVNFAPCDLKSVEADGTFTGYASLFGEVDLGHDLVMPGAFGESLRLRGARGVKLLFQHDPNEPIGVWLELAEDSRGLFARGRLKPEVTRAREVLSLMRAGALDGLSIGFRTVKGRTDPTTGVRRLDRSISGRSRSSLSHAARGAGERGEAAVDIPRTGFQRQCPTPAQPAPRHAANAQLARNHLGALAVVSPGASWRLSARLHRVSWLLHARVVKAKLSDLRRAVKAGFDPNQPRVPAGNPDGGQWTGAGEGGGGAGSGTQSASSGILTNIPQERPASARIRHAIIKELAKEAAIFVVGGAGEGSVGILLSALNVASWVHDYGPFIQSYVDPPKLLENYRTPCRPPPGDMTSIILWSKLLPSRMASRVP